jgi:hypothetical protein
MRPERVEEGVPSRVVAIRRRYHLLPDLARQPLAIVEVGAYAVSELASVVEQGVHRDVPKVHDDVADLDRVGDREGVGRGHPLIERCEDRDGQLASVIPERVPPDAHPVHGARESQCLLTGITIPAVGEVHKEHQLEDP